MRCKDVKAILDAWPESPLSVPVQDHLSACAECRELRRDLWLMRAGFHALAQEAPPEASLGFSARVVRRLGSAVESGGAAAEFIERIGRRFVLAGLFITMCLLLVFSLPSSGPFRGPAPDEPYISQSEPSVPGEVTYLGEEFGDTHETAPMNTSQGSGQTQK
jgi:hypothetical protein